VRTAILGLGVEVSRNTDRKVKSYASHSSFHSPDCRGRFAVAGESLHPNGRKYQVNLERSRRHLRRSMAPQRIRIVPFPVEYPRGIASATELAKDRRPRMAVNSLKQKAHHFLGVRSA
jgi:hypothetical protein